MLKRYEMGVKFEHGRTLDGILICTYGVDAKESERGYYVRYIDVEALQSKYEKLAAKLEKLTKKAKKTEEK